MGKNNFQFTRREIKEFRDKVKDKALDFAADMLSGRGAEEDFVGENDLKLTRQERREYRRRLKEAARSEKKSHFGTHLGVFAATNIFLGALNIFTSPGFPWSLIVAGGWGIGLVSHLRAVFNRRKKKKRQALSKTKTKEQKFLINELSKLENGFNQHLTSFVSTNAFLMMLNLITSRGKLFPWFLFVFGGWGIGMVAHWFGFKNKMKTIVKSLESQGVDIKALDRGFIPGRFQPGRETNPYLMEAAALKDDMLKDMANNSELKEHWGEEIEVLLNNFTTQIRELVKMNTELNEVTCQIDGDGLSDSIARLEDKRAAAANDELLTEYDRSITQYNHQLKTLEDLKNKQEVIQLRLDSSLVLLKQLKLDAARIKNIKTLEEPHVLREIRNKSSELSLYVDDLAEGLKELDV